VSEFFQGAETFASGLRVPKPYGDSIILEIVRESGGSVVASDDATILASILDWAKEEGIFLSPEGAAATAAYDSLLASGEIKAGERVVLFNTGGGDGVEAALDPPPCFHRRFQILGGSGLECEDCRKRRFRF
jgi:threonine synthase